MRKGWLILSLVGAILIGFWGCAQNNQVRPPEMELTAVEIGSSSAAVLMKHLKSHLMEAMEGNDVVSALEFCTLEALPLTQEVAKDLPAGVKIKRTSLKFRNHENAPDSIDHDVLEMFARAIDESGELPEHSVQYVESDREYRYYQPLSVGKLCLYCHGQQDQMDWEVLASLKENYPQDTAIGYQVGDFRGLIRVSIPESLVISDNERLWLKAAKDTERWIKVSALETEEGRTWPGVPGESQSGNNTLYSGTPGVVLFYLEAYQSTGDPAYLKEAVSGADYLLATLAREKMAGLYTGISGIGYALSETYRSSQEERFLEGFRECLQFIQNNAVKAGKGIQWSDTTDIISGNAGTGLFLLYAARVLEESNWLELADQAGQRMLELGQPEKGGLKWSMNPDYPRLMPNFSHGTAGIAYFLASLYMQTQHQEYLDAALAGATYLQAIADIEGDSCLIFHNEPDGEDLFYLGWCHGPVGTARLFYRLFQLTENREWLTWMEKGAQAILQSGIPENETPGFWNNQGQCCGSAGVADYLLSLYEIGHNPEYLELARKLTKNLLDRSSHDTTGLKWIHAEHRARPEFLQAQTGLMQGAAGIGLWLLRLDAFDRGKSATLFLPDNPFGR